jgi:hypothetical protein
LLQVTPRHRISARRQPVLVDGRPLNSLWGRKRQGLQFKHVTDTFRSNCGSALPDLQMNGTLLKVPAGSLDSDVLLRPDAHLFFASKANWDEALEKIPTVARLP